MLSSEGDEDLDNMHCVEKESRDTSAVDTREKQHISPSDAYTLRLHDLLTTSASSSSSSTSGASFASQLSMG